MDSWPVCNLEFVCCGPVEKNRKYVALIRVNRHIYGSFQEYFRYFSDILRYISADLRHSYVISPALIQTYKFLFFHKIVLFTFLLTHNYLLWTLKSLQVPVCYLMDFKNQDWSPCFSQKWVPQNFSFYLLYKMASIKLSHQYLIENVSLAVWIDQMINFIPIFTLQLLWEKEVFGGNNYLVNEQIMVKDCNLLPFWLSIKII